MDIYINYNIFLNLISGETLSIFNMFLVATLFSWLAINLKIYKYPFEVDTPINDTIFVPIFWWCIFKVIFLSYHRILKEMKLNSTHVKKQKKISDLTYTQQNLYLQKVDLMTKLKVSSPIVDLQCKAFILPFENGETWKMCRLQVLEVIRPNNVFP